MTDARALQDVAGPLTLAQERQLYGGRLPPANTEAEQALLAALLANNLAWEKVGDFLRPEHFADPAHGRIFEACGILIERGHPATAVSLKNRFDQDGDLAEVGGSQYLAELAANYVNIVDVRHYGRIVFDLWQRRQLIDIGEDVMAEAYRHDLQIGAPEQMALAAERLDRLAQAAGPANERPRLLRETLAETTALVDGIQSGRLSPGVPTGLDDLDMMIGALVPGDLLILAGRPSMGKTTLATTIARRVAGMVDESATGEDGAPRPEMRVVVFFSKEMSRQQLQLRLLSELSGAPYAKMLRRGALSREEHEKLPEARRALEALRLVVDDTAGLTAAQVAARARAVKRREGRLDLVVVDQLTQLADPDMRLGLVERIGERTKALKTAAKRLQAPFLVLHQLNRSVEHRDDKRPQMADLRDSGCVEQDADAVLFVFREEYYLERGEPMERENESREKFQERYARWIELKAAAANRLEIIAGKLRMGAVGSRRFRCDIGCGRVECLMEGER